MISQRLTPELSLPSVSNHLVRIEHYNKLWDDLFAGGTTAGNLSVNDLTVAGTATFNGTIVLGDAAADSLTVNATATYTDPINYSSETGITAFAGGGQASATALTEEINNITTCVSAGDSVKLPAAVAGKHVYVKNSGATALDIFPASSDSINALAVNLAVRIQPGSSLHFYAKDATVWESENDTSITIPAPTTVRGGLEIKAADSAGNTITTITNASQAAARTYTIPDSGASASFVMTEGAQTINGAKTFGTSISSPIITQTVATATTGLAITSDLTTANSAKTIETSRDINGTVAGAVALTNFANILGQAVSHTGGDFVVTQTATTAGILNLVLAHTTSIATTSPDVFASTALNIDVDATTSGDAGADLDVAARALNITYDLTETLGVLRLATTDIARIDLNVPAGITSAGAYTLSMLNLDGSGYLGDDANTQLRGLIVDLSGAKAVSTTRAIDVTLEAASGETTIGLFVDASGSAFNYAYYAYCIGVNTDTSSYGTWINKYVSLTTAAAADATNAGYAMYVDTSSRNADDGGFDAITTAGGIHIITGTINTATTAPTADTNSGKGIVIEVTASVADDANSVISTFSAGAIGVDYNLDRLAAGSITVDDWGGAGYLGIIAIDYDTSGAGTLTFGNGTYNFFSVVASDNATVPVYGTCTMTAYAADLSGLDVSDATLTLYGINITMPATYGAATEAAIYATGNTNVLSALGANGLALTMGTAASLGINILSDTVDANNSKQCIYASRDITGELTGDVAASLTVAEFRMDNINTSSTDFDLTSGGNVMVVAFSHTSTTTNAKTDTDPVTGRGLIVDIDLVTSAAIDKITVGATHTAFCVDYTETQTGGLISHQGFELASIQYNTTGNVDYTAGNYDLLYILGNNNAGTPTYAATTYISGLKMDLSAMSITDADLTLYGLNIVMPNAYGASTEIAARFAGDGRTLSLLTDTSHIYAAETLITDMPVTAPGAGFDTANGVKIIPYGKRGASGMFVTEIYVDLQAAAVSSVATLNDIIGEAAGGAAYIGQMTAALNGTVVAIEMVCLEAPATGDTDIDLYSATENTGAYDADVTGLTEVALITAGGAWTNGMVKGATALPAGASDYLYLASGNGGTAGAYSAGIFIIRIYGV